MPPSYKRQRAAFFINFEHSKNYSDLSGLRVGLIHEGYAAHLCGLYDVPPTEPPALVEILLTAPVGETLPVQLIEWAWAKGVSIEAGAVVATI